MAKGHVGPNHAVETGGITGPGTVDCNFRKPDLIREAATA